MTAKPTPRAPAVTLSTHILDLENGAPAAGVTVELFALNGGDATPAASGISDADGRIRAWSPEMRLAPGSWELRFRMRNWYEQRGLRNFHPMIAICFEVDGSQSHLHVPLLVNRFGYTTYRGS